MLIKAKIFEHYNKYSFKIPLTGGEKLYVKNQQRIISGNPLFSKTENRIKESYFLVDELGVKASECYKYITCINGEYIEKGEVLAEKKRQSGLTMKQIVSGVFGIVDFDRLDKGFVDVLAEEENIIVNSNFSGIITEILPGSHITINSPASALDLAATTLFDEKLFGNISFINKRNSIMSEIPDIDLKGKIVWVGSYLPLSLALKVFQKGARGILTYSMEYEDFKNLGLPIGVIEGFGKIHCDEKYLKELYKLDEKFAVLDSVENQLFVAKQEQIKTVEGGFFIKELLGARVISRHSAHYGYIGTIIQINDLNYVTVDFGTSGKSIVDLGSLDFITM
jgi:hypothetical protein